MLKVLLWIILFIVNGNAMKALRCNSSCYQIREHVTLNDGRRLSCKIQYVKTPPRSHENIGKAPPPKLMEETMLYQCQQKKNTKLALNVTWRQKEMEISRHDVRGYYIRVDDDSYYPMRYHVTIEIEGKKKSRMRHTLRDYIWFTFLCHGLNKNYYADVLRPGMKRTVAIDSLPLADINHNEGLYKIFVTIPAMAGKVDKQCSTTSRLDDPYKTNSSLSLFPAKAKIANEKSGNTVLPVFLAATVSISAAFAGFIWKRKNAKVGYENILAIADMDNEYEMDPHHAMMEKLSQQLGFKTESNWSSRNAIVQKSAAEWFRQQLEWAEIVIFVEPQFDVMPDKEYQQFWNNFVNSEQIEKKKSIFLQRSGPVHRYDAQRIRHFRIFPRHHEFAKEDAFFQHMKSLSKPKTKKKKKHGDTEDATPES